MNTLEQKIEKLKELLSHYKESKATTKNKQEWITIKNKLDAELAALVVSFQPEQKEKDLPNDYVKSDFTRISDLCCAEIIKPGAEEILKNFMNFLENETLDIVYHNEEQGKEYLINQYLKKYADQSTPGKIGEEVTDEERIVGVNYFAEDLLKEEEDDRKNANQSITEKIGAKEIFNKYCTQINRDYAEYIISNKKGLIKAIERYASQFQKETVTDVSGEEIKCVIANFKFLQDNKKDAVDYFNKWMRDKLTK
jgi:hypothetical protein